MPLRPLGCNQSSCELSLWATQPILVAVVGVFFLIEVISVFLGVLKQGGAVLLTYYKAVVQISAIMALAIISILIYLEVELTDFRSVLTSQNIRPYFNWWLAILYGLGSTLAIYARLNGLYVKTVQEECKSREGDLFFIYLGLVSSSLVREPVDTNQKTGAFSSVVGVPFKVWAELINRVKKENVSKVDFSDSELKELIKAQKEGFVAPTFNLVSSKIALEKAKAIVSAYCDKYKESIKKLN